MNCLWCHEPVLPGEAINRLINGVMHWECSMRSIAGSIGHQRGNCSCCGGTGNGDPEGVSVREAAQLAANEWIIRNRERAS